MIRSVSLDYKGLTPDQVEQSLRDTADRVTEVARMLAPARSGNLRRSIRRTFGRRGRTAVAFVEATARYAYFVHEGTGIYGPRGRPIVAAPGRVFAFPGRDGRMVYTRRILGSRPQPFLVDAVNQVLGR